MMVMSIFLTPKLLPGRGRPWGWLGQKPLEEDSCVLLELCRVWHGSPGT